MSLLTTTITRKMNILKFKASCIGRFSRLVFGRNIRFFSTNQPNDLNQIHSVDLTDFDVSKIRNFSIVAHVDHGKSTLADRILEHVAAIPKSKENKQVLDKLQVEKERGITVKAQTASFIHKWQEKSYLINLIDTPGHVDFCSEVSKSMSSCQGVILLVDANQGIQAQTVSNFFLAFENNLEIIPVLNKIDLPKANPDLVKQQLENMFDISPSSVILASAKTGQGIPEILDAVVSRVPPPNRHGLADDLKFFIQDSWYDPFKGSVNLIQMVDGVLRLGSQVTSCSTGKSFTVKNLAVLTPTEKPIDSLHPGQVGIFAANMRLAKDIIIGDTYHQKNRPVQPFMEIKVPKPMVYAGVYALDQTESPKLQTAIEKLNLNDSSVSVTKESSPALGAGFRLGFLGLLHMEVYCQRLKQEYDASVVVTTPNVPYKMILKPTAKNKSKPREILANSASDWIDKMAVETYYEPMVRGTIITPVQSLKQVQSMCPEYRGRSLSSEIIDQQRVKLEWMLPLNEIVTNFFDELKQVTSGFGSFDYESAGYEESSLIRLDILLNGNIVQELSVICHASKARDKGKRMVEKLKENLPRQQFLIIIQAAKGSTILARENIKPYRKNVTAKCYGGDMTRKMKLLKRQAEGKKKAFETLGTNVEVPKDVFVKVLKK